MALRNTNTWSAKDGLGDNRAGIACPNFTTPLIVADLNSLANEYPERNSRGDRGREPACGEFSLTGDPSFEFSWDQLSGHALLLKDKKPENSHQWGVIVLNIGDRGSVGHEELRYRDEFLKCAEYEGS